MNARFLIFFILGLFGVLNRTQGQSSFNNQYSLNNDLLPNDILFLKGRNIGVSYKNTVLVNSLNGNSPHLLNAFFTNNIGIRHPRKTQRTYFSYGLGMSDFKYGGVFSNFSGKAIFGMRYNLDGIGDWRDNNNHLSLAGEVSMTQVQYTGIDASSFIWDNADPLLFGSLPLEQYVHYKVGVGFNKSIWRSKNYVPDYLRFAFGIKSFVPEFSTRDLVEQIQYFGRVNYYFSYFKKVFNYGGRLIYQPLSVFSIQVPYSFLSSNTFRISPSFQMPLNYKPSSSFNSSAIRLGVGYAFNKYMGQNTHGVSVSIGFEFNKLERRDIVKLQRLIADVNLSQGLGNLAFYNGQEVNFIYNTDFKWDNLNENGEKLERIIANAKNMINAGQYGDAESLIASAKAQLQEISNSPFYDSYGNKEKYIRLVSDLNDLYSTLAIESVEIDGREWANKNSNNVENISYASNWSQWKEYCEKGMPAYCYKYWDESNKNLGCIYNQFALSNIDLPDGWRVANTEDWKSLIHYCKISQAKMDYPMDYYCLKCELSKSKNISPIQCGSFSEGEFDLIMSGYLNFNGSFKNGESVGIWSTVENSPLKSAFLIKDQVLVNEALDAGGFEHEVTVIKNSSSKQYSRYYGFYIRLVKEN
jgi:uncharacterized protein (TIGR02145 family)